MSSAEFFLASWLLRRLILFLVFPNWRALAWLAGGLSSSRGDWASIAETGAAKCAAVSDKQHVSANCWVTVTGETTPEVLGNCIHVYKYRHPLE